MPRKPLVTDDDVKAFWSGLPAVTDAVLPPGGVSRFHDDNERYHGDRLRDSSSTLKQYLNDSHVYYRERIKQDAPVKDESKERLFGSLFHTLLFEPKAAGTRFFHARDTTDGKKPDERSNVGKAMMATLKDMAAGRPIVYDADYHKADQMALAIMAHPKLGRMLMTPGLCEASAQWTDLVDGVPMPQKVKYDRLCFLGKRSVVIFDVKTAAEPEPYRFYWNARDFGYPMQAEHYRVGAERLGLRVLGHVMCVVGTSWPFHAAQYTVHEEYRGPAMVARRSALERLAEIRRRVDAKALTVDQQARLYAPAWTVGNNRMMAEGPKKG